MNLATLIYPILGGAIIGLAVTLMLLSNGRVTGISGIISSAFSGFQSEGLWRWLFIVGMLTGGGMMSLLRPELFVNQSDRGLTTVIVAGLLVGFGTVMGSGCTSGHGICGISRLSGRSILATLTFMLFGFISVQALRLMLGAA